MATMVDVELANIGTCRACGQQIGWVRLPGDIWRPVDPEPNNLGEIAMLRDGVRAIALPTTDVRVKWDKSTQYRNHFNTCPAPRGSKTLTHTLTALLDGRSTEDPKQERLRGQNLARDRARDRASGGRNKYF